MELRFFRSLAVSAFVLCAAELLALSTGFPDRRLVMPVDLNARSISLTP
jgi:hypothetical protein